MVETTIEFNFFKLSKEFRHQKMSRKEILKIGDFYIKKHRFHILKNPTDRSNVDTEHIQAPK